MSQATDAIPVLTDVVEEESRAPAQATDRARVFLEQFESHLTAVIHEHADELVHNACREMEALLLEQVSDRLKAELPGLVSAIIVEHFQGPQRAN